MLILPKAFYFSVTFLSDSLSLDKSGIYFCYNKQQFLYRPSRDFGKMDYRANDGISSLRIRGRPKITSLFVGEFRKNILCIVKFRLFKKGQKADEIFHLICC